MKNYNAVWYCIKKVNCFPISTLHSVVQCNIACSCWKTPGERGREAIRTQRCSVSIVSSLHVVTSALVNDETLLYPHSVLVFSRSSVTRFSTPDTVVSVVSREIILSSRATRTDRLDIPCRETIALSRY